MPRPDVTPANGWRGVAAHTVGRLRRTLEHDPLAMQRVLVVVPSAAAVDLFSAQIEDALVEDGRGGVVLPTVTTNESFFRGIAVSQGLGSRTVDPLIREALLERAFQHASTEGVTPPFHVRPSLATRVLDFYDELLLRSSRTGPNEETGPVDSAETGNALERFVLRALEELDAPDDEGAERMTQQTRFLARSLELYRLSLDELELFDWHSLRRALIEMSRSGDLELPYDEVIVIGEHTLSSFDIEFFTHAPGPSSITWLVPDLAQHRDGPRTALLTPSDNELVFVSRDREESVMDAARVLAYLEDESKLPPLHRIAIVVPDRLPYLYLAKKVFVETGIPFELRDSFPLAAEPYLAAVDLILELVATDAHRSAALALLRSPFFRFPDVGPREVAALDEYMLRVREMGGWSRFRRLLERKSRPETQPSLPGMESRDASRRIVPALRAIVEASRALSPLGEETSMSNKVDVLERFLAAHLIDFEQVSPDQAKRHRRAKAALDSILERLVRAAEYLGDPPTDFASFRERFRRAVFGHTFSERSGLGGVQVVDRNSAGYGGFDLVLLLGVNDSEWPARDERNIFYPLWLLREFGWPSDRERLEDERTRFQNLLSAATSRVALFRNQLEDETPTVPSPFLEDVASSFGHHHRGTREHVRTPIGSIVLSRREALRRGLGENQDLLEKPRAGIVQSPPPPPDPVSPTSFELFLRCPFKYYARYVLQLPEEEELDDALTPLERGRILHEVLRDGFEQWDALSDVPRPIDPDSYDEALSLFRKVALQKIPYEHRGPEMARLFGTRSEVGALEWLLRREMTLPPRQRRLVESPFQTPLRLARGPSGESPWFVQVKGRVDRADVSYDQTLSVYDYKSGRAPAVAVTLQVPLYAMCLSQELGFPVREAAYIGFRDRKLTMRADYQRASATLIEVYKRVRAGHFMPRPHRDHLCFSCGYVTVCRKEIDESNEEPAP